MAYPWVINANMGFRSVPVLRALWTPEFRRQYQRSLRLATLRNNLTRLPLGRR